ncbi:MAG: carboxypeptidase-like regulatory domain-containing protein [Acidobacteriota bacterium]
MKRCAKKIPASRFPFAAFILIAAALLAQSQSRVIEFAGEVKDQLGDAIAGAKIILSGRETISDNRGRFRIGGISAGAHALKITAEGFAPHEETLTLSNSHSRLTVTLYPSIKETVSVKDDPDAVSLDPQRAAGAQVIDERMLKALPDDPDRLMELLQLLATSSGSAPGQATVTVDGFANEGRLPPKSAIREVRINSNIFSAEYDKPPYRGGRIDVYTKPGAGSFHGEAAFNFNDSRLNARDVFARQRAPITTRRYGLQLGGPVVRKRAGFLFDFEARDIRESATVNAVILDPGFQPSPFVANVSTPKRLLIGSLRGDWQMNASHTFIARYDFNEDRSSNQGAGGFNLEERASTLRAASHSLRFAETAIIGKAMFNEARLSLTVAHATERAASGERAITVLGAFSSGGATAQSITQNEKRAELTDNLSIVAGNHSLKIGAQVAIRKVSDSRADNFNGVFIFGGAIAPALDDDGKVITENGRIVMTNISGLEQYRRALLGLEGGRPTRFSINRGDPLVEADQLTVSGFLQDEWHARQNLLLSLGLRYESQTAPSDGASLGPRLGIGYSPDKKRRWVMRARAGLFYDRIALPLTLEAVRLDGRHQQQIIIDSPSFPDPFSGGAAVEVIPIVRRIGTDLRPPVSFQAQAGFERQLPHGWKIELSHYWSRSWGMIRSRNINAPIISEGDYPQSAPRPLGVKENILQFESSGSLTGRVLFIGVNQSSNRRFNLFTGYLWFDFRTNADYPFLLPQSSYAARGEWARPVWQASHRVFIVGLINLPWKLRASTEFNLATGVPFNITTGRDNNGDGNFNDRPSRVAANDPRAVETHLGAFDPSVINGTLGRNAGTNPLSAVMDVNLSRTFSLSGKGKNDRSHQLTLNLRANNLLNRANLGGIDGALNSPFFGRANNAAPARRIEVGARLTF